MAGLAALICGLMRLSESQSSNWNAAGVLADFALTTPSRPAIASKGTRGSSSSARVSHTDPLRLNTCREPGNSTKPTRIWGFAELVARTLHQPCPFPLPPSPFVCCRGPG